MWVRRTQALNPKSYIPKPKPYFKASSRASLKHFRLFKTRGWRLNFGATACRAWRAAVKGSFRMLPQPLENQMVNKNRKTTRELGKKHRGIVAYLLLPLRQQPRQQSLATSGLFTIRHGETCVGPSYTRKLDIDCDGWAGLTETECEMILSLKA